MGFHFESHSLKNSLILLKCLFKSFAHIEKFLSISFVRLFETQNLSSVDPYSYKAE